MSSKMVIVGKDETVVPKNGQPDLLEQLVDELKVFQTEHKLPRMCASDQLVMNDNLTEYQRLWLNQFSERWNFVVELDNKTESNIPIAPYGYV